LSQGAPGSSPGTASPEPFNEGFRVRTTVRDLAREPGLRANVGSLVEAGDRLEVVTADLTSDTGWSEAAAGCTYVLHVASPFPSTSPQNDDDLVRPARDGTLRVLAAARTAGVSG